MSGDVWVVRAGERAKFAAEFLAGGYIAINFDELAADDLSLIDDGQLRSRATTPTERNYAGQLAAFAYQIDVGDLVIVPRVSTAHRDYLVGRVASGYQYVAAALPSGHHRRTVEWLGSFRRESLSQAALNTLGAILTIFRPRAVEAEIRTLLTSLDPVDSTGDGAGQVSARLTLAGQPDVAPVGVSVEARPLVGVQLDVEVDPAGRARIVCGHPALVMEQTPRHVDPGSDWAGVPGIYVLTGTDLQHSSTRTGNERTLTTTLIVRPWAYVGLSEDFSGRIGSHRQGKPEWRRALLVRSGGQPFGSDDIKYLEQKVHAVLQGTGEVILAQASPRGNLSARPRNPAMLDACAEAVVAVLRLTGTLI